MADIIDMHTHIFRDKAHSAEGRNYLLSGQAIPRHVTTEGTVDETFAMMSATGVSRANFLMFTWTGRYYQDGLYTLPDRGNLDRAEHELRTRVVHRLVDNNSWAERTVKEHPTLSYFCGIDPVLMTTSQLLEEVDTRVRGGALGVVVVPQDLRIRADDNRMQPLYDYCSSQQVPIIMSSSGADPRYGRPLHMRSALTEFPKLQVVFSHIGKSAEFGDETDRDVIALAREFAGVYTDTSMRLADVARGNLQAEDLVAHIRALGVDRVMYGSGYCFNELTRNQESLSNGTTAAGKYGVTIGCVELLHSLPFSASEFELLAAENFTKLVEST